MADESSSAPRGSVLPGADGQGGDQQGRYEQEREGDRATAEPAPRWPPDRR
ncbi:hypothetical protein [Streptomyces sp. NPDC007007]|uniref:hypothetical protein n=1 Tax=Streptomyces sp. NPDC007007 TaxID=3364770 RepID=UPI00369C7A8D